MEKDLFSKSSPVFLIDEEAVATETTTYSEWIDSSGYESFVGNVFMAGSKGEITGLVLQGADKSDKSDAATLNDDFLLWSKDSFPVVAGAGSLLYFGVISKTRYFRVGFVSANAGGSVALKLVGGGLLSDAKVQPPVVASSAIKKTEINAPSYEADTNVTPPKRAE